MGTYTTNYNLFMPTVGETGWGTLVNGNFSTIDTTMKGLDTRITAVENEVNGALSCTSITTSGKITGGTGEFSGAVSGTSGTFDYIGLRATKTTTVTDYVYAICAEQSLTASTSAQTIKIPGYTFNELPMKVCNGVYITSASGSDPSPTTRTLYIASNSTGTPTFYIKESSATSYTSHALSGYGSKNITVTIGKTYNYYWSTTTYVSNKLNALSTYYLATKTP